MKNDRKTIFGVTRNGSLVFLNKKLIYSPSICYCLMKNKFSQVKKTANSFTSGVEHPWRYV